jgi:hypothetical protein
MYNTGILEAKWPYVQTMQRTNNCNSYESIFEKASPFKLYENLLYKRASQIQQQRVFNEEVLSFYVRWAFCALQQLIVFLLNVQYIFVTDSCEKPESKNGPL